MRPLSLHRLFLNRKRLFGTVLASGLIIWLFWETGSKPAPVRFSPTSVIRQYDEAYYRGRLDSLRQTFGYRKQFPPEYELQALLALSHYPELRQRYIRLIFVDEAIPLIASRPDPGNLFRRKKNWVYNIILSKKSPPTWDTLLFKNFSFNAQIGILGHEMSHTVSYLDKSAGQILWIGLQYLFSAKFKANFERNTDRDAIIRGLGWQVYAYAKHYQENRRLTSEERQYFETNYLNPAAVVQYMRTCGYFSKKKRT